MNIDSSERRRRRSRGCEYRIDSLKEEEVEEVHSTSQFFFFYAVVHNDVIHMDL